MLRTHAAGSLRAWNGGQKVTLQAQGTFIGIPNWTYIQTFQGGASPLAATEVPTL